MSRYYRLAANHQSPTFQVPHPGFGGTRPFLFAKTEVLDTEGERWFEKGQSAFWDQWSELVVGSSAEPLTAPVLGVPAPPEPPKIVIPHHVEPKPVEVPPNPELDNEETDDLRAKTNEELKRLASDLGVPNFGQMNKNLLISAIRTRRAERPE